MDYRKRRESLGALRLPHESHYRDCADFAAPHRSIGWDGAEQSAEDIAERKARVMDDTLGDAASQLSATAISGSCPASAQWFDFDDGDAEDEDAASEEGRWLDTAANLVWRNIHAANFDSEINEAILDYITFGFGVILVTEKDEGGYLFEWVPAHQCKIASSKPGSLIDTLYRDYALSVEQIIGQFSSKGDTIPDKIRKKMDSSPDEMIKLCHAIQPRRKGERKGSKGLSFASVHFVVDSGEVLRESGYHEQPFAVGRGNIMPGSAYSTGQVAKALPSAKTLNQLKFMQLNALEMNVAGMWRAVDDGVLNPAGVKIKARTVIPMRDKDSLTPLRDAVDFQASFLSEERLQAQIKRIMMADQLTPPQGPAMTATEIQLRSQMILAQLGPMASRLQSEFLSVIVDRCFGLLYRAGILPPVPEGLFGKTIRPRYLSSINRAQKFTDVTAIEATVQTLGMAAQMDPTILDNIDMDAAARQIADLRGAAKILRSEEDRDNLRKERSDAQQQQQNQMMMAQMAQAQGQGA